MSPEEKTLFKESLEKKTKRLVKHISDLEELTQPIAPENAIGRVSRMDAINNKSVNEAALRKAKEELKQLQHALEVMDEPNFGLCNKCGENIRMQRLLIMPGSRRCVKCAR